MYIAILGRQPEISLAEICTQFGNAKRISGKIAEFELPEAEKLDFLRQTSVLTEVGEPNIDRFGGSLKFAKKLEQKPLDYLKTLPEGKIILGVSDYSKRASKGRAIHEALKLKQILKKQGRNVRVLPNSTPEISSAVACHEKLGRKPLHVELISFERNWYLSLGSQDIEAYSRRDQARPARDAKVGMLPPKLAQILINLCGPLKADSTVLDPFCGTGVVLQEARLMGYSAYGTDISERIVDFAQKNLDWQTEKTSKKPLSTEVNRTDVRLPDYTVEVGDATNFVWKKQIDAVAAEIYLGPPMSQAPVEIKLKTAQQECGTILRGFLKNVSAQVKSGTPVVLAIPAWIRPDGSYAHLNIDAGEYGFKVMSYARKPLDEKGKMRYNDSNKLGFSGLLYARPDQVVAREIIALRKN
ncbi:MAG: DNA methyltransferase [Candidatus Saccharibacteria bacterium]|nr:DNA methyltransferase [Candidatus Saccharibacteria bacterium]